MKPDIEIFKIAVEKSGYKPEETVMIGDRLDNDIYPAKQIGMKTVWIKQGFGGMQKPKSEMYIPDREIFNLEDLVKIFKVNSVSCRVAFGENPAKEAILLFDIM